MRFVNSAISALARSSDASARRRANTEKMRALGSAVGVPSGSQRSMSTGTANPDGMTPTTVCGTSLKPDRAADRGPVSRETLPSTSDG